MGWQFVGISNRFCDEWDLELQCLTATQQRAASTSFLEGLPVDTGFLPLLHDLPRTAYMLQITGFGLL